MFLEYLKLGIDHILDLNGIDHLLFLVALVIVYNLKQWKQVLILATAFTLGHSITLALSSFNLIKVNTTVVEIFIAVSIGWTAAYNIFPKESGRLEKLRYITALLFGLIHGLGFSNFFKTILGKESIIQPLLAFNIGVELAQVLIVLVTLLISYALIKFLKIKKRSLSVSTSFVILIWSLKLVLERL